MGIPHSWGILAGLEVLEGFYFLPLFFEITLSRFHTLIPHEHSESFGFLGLAGSLRGYQFLALSLKK